VAHNGCSHGRAGRTMIDRERSTEILLLLAVRGLNWWQHRFEDAKANGQTSSVTKKLEKK
jgi:hypothetical protein